MAATVPPANDNPGKLDALPDQVDSDIDAEGEEETDLYQMDQQLQDAVHRAYSGEEAEDIGDSADSEAMRDDANSDRLSGDNDETEPVGAVKVPDDEASSEDEDADADADGDPAFEDENDRDASNAESSEGESEAEEDWEAESNGGEDADADIRSRANCM
jgi:histone acetyltransferase SAS3